jgi:RNA recognition motif-containing protein
MPPLPPGPPPPPSTINSNNTAKNSSSSNNSSKPVVRMAAGTTWVDSTLADWPENDFRIFVGNLGADVDDTQLHDHFATRYSSVAMSKIVRDPSDEHKSRGYGFVSFLLPLDCAKAIREQDQAWLGSRPIRVKRSDWKDRNRSAVQKKHKKERKQQHKRGGGRRY